MTRLLVHVEGQTEEEFVKVLLQAHLLARGYASVSARIPGNARVRRQRGGIRPWPDVRSDIVRHLKEDRSSIATTMVDYYGLPSHGPRGWPGRERAAGVASPAKALCVEDAMLEDIGVELGDTRRFIPFVVMHEFEGLLFSDCAAFSRGIARPDLQSKLQNIRDEFATPEDINDSPITAPSKRVEGVVPGYEKPLLGILAALEIGLQRIRAECPHFSDWLRRLESLG